MPDEISAEDREKAKNGTFIIVYIAVVVILVITTGMVEVFFFPVPKGTIGWNFYTLFSIVQIGSLIFYRWFFKLAYRKKKNALNPKNILNQARLTILSALVGGLIIFSIDKFHPEIIPFFGAWLVISAYLLFIKWKIPKAVLSDAEKNSKIN